MGGAFNSVGFSGITEGEIRRGLRDEVVLEVSGFLTLLGNKYVLSIIQVYSIYNTYQ